MGTGNPIRRQFRPSIKGLVDPRVEAVIRSLEEQLSSLKASVEMVKAAKFVPSTIATQQYSPAAIRKAISASGQTPLDVSNLPGLLLQPQRSGVPGVDALPGWNNLMSQEGAVLALRPTLAMYRFDGLVSPGVWRALGATAVVQFGTRAAMPAAGNAGYMYYQTDLQALYYDNGTNYIYGDGLAYGTDAARLALGIGVNDNSLPWLTSDTKRVWRVVGGVWTDVTPSPVIGSPVNLTGQTTSIGDTLLYAVPATGAGLYRVSYYLITTTAGNVVTCLMTTKWTDTEQAQAVASATIDISTDADFEYGSIVLYSAATQNINYATTVSGPIGAGVYALYLRVEALR